MGTSMRRSALAGVAGSVIGILGAGTLFLIEPRVSDDRVSYPLTAGTFRLTELVWTLSHVFVLVAMVSFLRSGVAGRSRPARVAGVVALVGFAMQVLAEFSYIFFAEAMVDDPGPLALSTAFGISSLLIGLGLIGLGASTLRARAWSGWQRYAPLAWGIWSIAFIPLTFGDLFFVGIVSWYAVGLLLWAAMLSSSSSTTVVRAPTVVPYG